MSGGQLVNAGKGGDRIRNVTVVEVFQQALRVNLSQFGSDCKNRFDLGTKIQIAIVQRVMDRFLAQAIARQNQFSLVLVIDREAEHAAQLLYAVDAHLFVEVNDAFGVCPSIE